MLYTGHYESPLGGITLACDGTALTELRFDTREETPRKDVTHEETPREELPPEAAAVFTETVRWLDLFFAGKDPGFTPALAPEGTAFRKHVWELLLEIPYGETVTYGQIAERIAEERGLARMSAQAVGGAVGSNPIPLIIPCHRVIGADGSLVGYGCGLWRKERLLALEQGMTGEEGDKTDD